MAEGLTCTGTVQLSCSGVRGRGLAKATPAWTCDFDRLFLRFFRALLCRFPFRHTRAILPSVAWATLLGIWSRLSDWLSERGQIHILSTGKREEGQLRDCLWSQRDSECKPQLRHSSHACLMT